jgi:uncharacterized protein YecE (DUF72 family)
MAMPDDPKSNAGHIRIGIGGWVYPPWRGTFYPPRLPQSQELAHASRHLTAIEINGTFYNSGRPDSFRKWRDDTPENFVFSLKGPRFVTHRNELASAGDALDLFFSRGVLELGDKLGAILWQFAPFKPFDAADFAAFLKLLPHAIAGRAIRHVVEVRHASFRTPAFFDLLREHRVAVAMVDDAKFPAFDEITADFVYLRLRRCIEEEPTGYPSEALDEWAERARGWAAAGRDVFLYFINGAKVRAPAAAQELIQRLA